MEMARSVANAVVEVFFLAPQAVNLIRWRTLLTIMGRPRLFKGWLLFLFFGIILMCLENSFVICDDNLSSRMGIVHGYQPPGHENGVRLTKGFGEYISEFAHVDDHSLLQNNVSDMLKEDWIRLHKLHLGAKAALDVQIQFIESVGGNGDALMPPELHIHHVDEESSFTAKPNIFGEQSVSSQNTEAESNGFGFTVDRPLNANASRKIALYKQMTDKLDALKENVLNLMALFEKEQKKPKITENESSALPTSQTLFIDDLSIESDAESDKNSGAVKVFRRHYENGVEEVAFLYKDEYRARVAVQKAMDAMVDAHKEVKNVVASVPVGGEINFEKRNDVFSGLETNSFEAISRVDVNRKEVNRGNDPSLRIYFNDDIQKVHTILNPQIHRLTHKGNSSRKLTRSVIDNNVHAKNHGVGRTSSGTIHISNARVGIGARRSDGLKDYENFRQPSGFLENGSNESVDSNQSLIVRKHARAGGIGLSGIDLDEIKSQIFTKNRSVAPMREDRSILRRSAIINAARPADVTKLEGQNLFIKSLGIKGSYVEDSCVVMHCKNKNECACPSGWSMCNYVEAKRKPYAWTYSFKKTCNSFNSDGMYLNSKNTLNMPSVINKNARIFCNSKILDYIETISHNYYRMETHKHTETQNSKPTHTENSNHAPNQDPMLEEISNSKKQQHYDSRTPPIMVLCKEDEPACQVSAWSEWSTCSAPCGKGYKYRYRIPVIDVKNLEKNSSWTLKKMLGSKSGSKWGLEVESEPKSGSIFIPPECRAYHFEERVECENSVCPETVVASTCSLQTIQNSSLTEAMDVSTGSCFCEDPDLSTSCSPAEAIFSISVWRNQILNFCRRHTSRNSRFGLKFSKEARKLRVSLGGRNYVDCTGGYGKMTVKEYSTFCQPGAGILCRSKHITTQLPFSADGVRNTISKSNEVSDVGSFIDQQSDSGQIYWLVLEYILHIAVLCVGGVAALAIIFTLKKNINFKKIQSLSSFEVPMMPIAGDETKPLHQRHISLSTTQTGKRNISKSRNCKLIDSFKISCDEIENKYERRNKKDGFYRKLPDKFIDLLDATNAQIIKCAGVIREVYGDLTRTQMPSAEGRKLVSKKHKEKL